MASKKATPRVASPIRPEVSPTPATPQVISVTSTIPPKKEPTPTTLPDPEGVALAKQVMGRLGTLPFSQATQLIQEMIALAGGMPIRFLDNIIDSLKPEVHTPEEFERIRRRFHEIRDSLPTQ